MFNRKPAYVKLYNCPMDTSTAAFVSATGLTGTTEINAINNLVKRLKSYGLWSKMKAIYPFVSDTNNQLSYTSDLSNAYWTKLAVTLTQNADTAPDGTNTANKIIETTATSGHWVKAAFNITASTTYTMSGYFKASGRNYVALIDDDSGVHTAYFNLSNGTLVSQSGFTSTSITSVGNGWYRCSVTRNSITTLSNFYWAISSNGTTYNYTGDGVNGVLVWGTQWEYNASATTYQPIATTPANRFVSQFKYNLKDPRDLDAAFRLAFSGTWAYTKQGATPNGVNAFADTKLNPTTVGFTQTDTHISAYLRTDSNGSKVDIGGSYNLFMGARWANNYNYPINRSNNANGTSADSIGYFLASRVDNVRDRMFKNGTNVTNFNTAAVSLDNNSIIISATNGGGLYSDRQTAFNTIGNGLTDTEATNLYTSVQIFQQDLSRAVGTPIVTVSDPDAQAFVTATQIQNTLQANAVNTLVTGLKSANLWSKMKAIYPFVSDTYNQLSYTSDLSNAYWTKTAVTLTQNAGTAPDGTNTANKIIETTATSGHWVKAAFNITASTTYTMSGYFKASGRNYVALIDDDSGVHTAYFNLSNGTLVSQSGFTSTSITSVGNGWYRCSVTRNSITTLSNFYWAISSNGTTYNYTGDGVNGVLVWGTQWEYNSSATPYTANLTTPANRFVSQFKYNLKDPRDLDAAYRLAFFGSWTYSSTGITGNGISTYAITYLNPSINLPSSQNSSIYLRTYATGGSSYPKQFAAQASPRFNYIGGANHLESYMGANTTVINDGTNTIGYFSAGGDNTLVYRKYRNNARITKADVYLGANTNMNIGDSQANFTTACNISFFNIGDSLSDSEISSVYTLVQAFQTTLGRQV